jgi:phospholipid/cholesterol/gamma-HCH transport system substrate-binding protein
VNLRTEARWLWPIGLIIALALGCGAFILNKQRLQSPLASRYTLFLQFDAVDGVTASVGSPVTVAGVAVGQIDRAELVDGRGVVRVQMNPIKLPRVRADATAALVPNTPLKDMQIRLFPGTRRAAPLADGATITLRSTTSPIDSDELLKALDGDTRAWMQSLFADTGIGLAGRRRDLRAVLRAMGPTAVQMRRITSLMAERRAAIPKLVHDLRVITEATERSGELRQVVEAGNATLAALAAGEEPLKRSLDLLPGTLREARTTLDGAIPFSAALTRTLGDLDPTLQSLRTTLRATPDGVRGIVPLPTAQLERFIDAVVPLAAQVQPASRDLAAAREPLERAFASLGRATNQLTFQAAPDSQSYLFWMAWFAHNLNSALSTGDSHGAVLRGYAMFSCSSPEPPEELDPLFDALGLAGACKKEGAR